MRAQYVHLENKDEHSLKQKDRFLSLYLTPVNSMVIMFIRWIFKL